MIRHAQIAFAAALFGLAAGCVTTSSIETGRAHPSLEIENGYVKIDGKTVKPMEVPEILEEHGISHDTVIHIRLNELDKLNEAQLFRGILANAGYRRTALVTKEHAEAWSRASREPAEPARQKPPARPRLRYRSATE